jgi:hypothetical protein
MTPTNENQPKETERNDLNAVKEKLLSGGYGLTVTFWLWWFLPTVLIILARDHFNIPPFAKEYFYLNVANMILDGFMCVAVKNTINDNNKIMGVIATVIIGFLFITRGGDIFVHLFK